MKRILVVDDMPAIREPIAAALQAKGFETTVAAGGAEALQAVTSRKPDLILLDLAMPTIDGISMLKTLRADPDLKRLPVIVLSSYADRKLVESAAKLGVSGYMLKSRFSMRELMQQVEKCFPADSTQGSTAEGGGSPPSPPEQTPTVVAAIAPSESNTGEAPAATELDADPGECLRQVKPIMTRSEITNLIDLAGELKGFSPTVTDVLMITGRSHCSIEQVAKAIGRDHAIAFKILKLANSAVYNRGEPVDSVFKAVQRIGLDQIRQVALNVAIIEQFSAGGIEGYIESGQFWEHSIATGIIAAEIAHTRSEKEADTAFTCGLLHDVGRMVFVGQMGDAFRQALKTAADLQLPLEQVEQRMLCFNHADIMDRLLRAWKFSTHLINPIVFHHLSANNIRATAPRDAQQIATLAVANRLAHAFMLGSSGNQAIYPTEDLCELLKLDASVIARIESMAREETDKVKFALLATSNQSNWTPLRDVHRRALAQPLRPLYVSSSPAIDAHRIFFDQLAQRDGEAALPNIGVIHLRHARERASLSDQFRASEKDAGASNLPLLVISSAGRHSPDPALLEGRMHMNLATPFAVQRCMSVLNELLGVQRHRAAA